MKKYRSNIMFHELRNLKHQHKLFVKELKASPTSPLLTAVISHAAQEMGRPPSTSLEKMNSTDVDLIGGRSKSHTRMFIFIFEVFNKNFHNFLVDFGTSSNILPKTVCAKLNVKPRNLVFAL